MFSSLNLYWTVWTNEVEDTNSYEAVSKIVNLNLWNVLL